MTSITQTIPTYNGGISQQPDELKLPGQVKDALNVIPDLTHGLLKRPGSRLIGSNLSSDTNGKWFHYYRDENEQYIGQIKRSDGTLRMWKCSDGTEYSESESNVIYDSGTATALKTYLTHTADDDLQTLTLNDYTYVTNRTKNTAMSSAVAPSKPAEAYVELKNVAYSSQYGINLFDDNTLQEEEIVTRVDIENVIDSKTCGRAAEQSGGDDTKGKGPPKGAMCGTRQTDHNYNDFTIITGAPYWDPQAGHSHVTVLDDAMCPNIGTDIYSVSAGEAWKDPKNNSNGVGGVHLVNRSGTWYVNGEVHESAEFSVANSTGYTLVVDPSGINDTLTYTTDSSATFDELIAGLQADGDYDTTKYTIQRAGRYWTNITTENEQMGRIQVIFKEHTGTKSASTLGGTAMSRTSTAISPYATDHLPTSYSYTKNDSIKPKNLYFRITCLGQSTSGGSATTAKYNCRYNYTLDLLHGGQGWKEGDYFFIWHRNARYKITIKETSIAKMQANLGMIRPTPTPFDAETTITPQSILGDIRTDMIAADPDADDWVDWDEGNGYGIKQIGNGFYIKRKDNTAFGITTPVSDLLNVMTDSIQDIADLPRQCRHGYVIKVANSEAEEDDYYLKFFGKDDRDGEGVWEECTKWDRKIAFDPATMPIQIISNANNTFTVKQVDWDDCLVGDQATVPKPSFISTVAGSDGDTVTENKQITKMLFFRNRLVLLSDEDVIMSRPGKFFNFWPKTAVTYTNTDNIDVSCSSEYPAIIYDGIQVNSGLLLFTKNQQFMLTTDSDVLSPQTAKINSVSTYNFNSQTNPISLGTTVGFLDNAGKNTRFFEMSTVLREGQPEIIEQSKIVSKLFPKDIGLIANSRENSVIFFCEKNKDEIYGYRYFSSIEKRLQNAWFRWKLSGNIQHLCMLDDALYAVVRNGSTDVLQKFSIKLEDTSNFLVNDLGSDSTDDDLTYRLHLDNATEIAWSSLSNYDSANNWTTFTLPSGFNNSDAQLAVISKPTGADKTFQGATEEVYTFDDSGTTKVKLHGNWKTYDPQEEEDGSSADDVNTNCKLILGYLYDMEVKLPTLYYQTYDGSNFRSEIQGSLVIHRLKFSFGPLGVYEAKLERVGKPTYTELYEAVMADEYISNRVQFTPGSHTTVPVYERNTNVTLTIKSTHPSPATLYSMSWEGDYTNRYYKRV